MQADDRDLVTVEPTADDVIADAAAAQPDDLRPVPADPDFGRKMRALHQARGYVPPGRPKIADKYRDQIDAAQQKFADAMPAAVDEFVTELRAKDPEKCPTHKRVLSCPQCSYTSQRTTYNHAAAAYVFDRIMGRPTSRSENTITIKLVQGLMIAIVEAFQEINGIADETERALEFAARCRVIGTQWGS